MLNPGREISGECFHVGDSYVWSEIRYLDSATDYRDFLPQRPIQPTAINSELVMLDSHGHGMARDRVVSLILLLIPVVIFLLVLYFEL